MKAERLALYRYETAARDPMQHWNHRKAAFEQEAMPHTGSLLRTALRLTNSRAIAEDLVQDTLLSAWRAFDRFQTGTDCKAWLFRIMLNGSNRMRKQSKIANNMVPVEDADAPALRSRFDPVLNEEIDQALAQLPEEQRLAFLLAAVEGFTAKEIASMTDAPIGTVMSRISRARTALKAQLLPSAAACTSARKRANGL